MLRIRSLKTDLSLDLNKYMVKVRKIHFVGVYKFQFSRISITVTVAPLTYKYAAMISHLKV